MVICYTGSLTLPEKELIIVATSAANNCLYCVVTHSAIHRMVSKELYKADQVNEWLKSIEKSLKKNALQTHSTLFHSLLFVQTIQLWLPGREQLWTSL